MEFIGISQRKLDLRRRIPGIARRVRISVLPRGSGLTVLVECGLFIPEAKATRVGSDGAKNLGVAL
jgi:hypothetical protein